MAMTLEYRKELFEKYKYLSSLKLSVKEIANRIGVSNSSAYIYLTTHGLKRRANFIKVGNGEKKIGSHFYEHENLVYEARISVGLSQQELAARVGVSCHTICNIELGYSSPFRSSKKRGMYIKPYIEKLCNVLGFEFADLFPREVCNIWKSNLSDDQIVMITVGEYHRKNQIDRMMIAYLRIGVSKVLNTLSDKEAMAIELVYGLNGYGNMTLQSIGEAIGVSKERVRQIIAKALRKLRHPYRRKIIDEYNIFESSSAYRMKGYDPCELLE